MKIDKSWYPFLVLILVVIIGLVIQEYRKSELLELEQRYTIGIIRKVDVLRKKADAVTFDYEIDGLEYSIRSSFNRRVKVGEKYLVTLPRGHEDNGYLLTDHPVPDGVKAPSNGWDEMPNF